MNPEPSSVGAVNCDIASPLPKMQKMLPVSEIMYTPSQTNNSHGLISISSIGDEDDDSLFESPIHCKNNKKLTQQKKLKGNKSDDSLLMLLNMGLKDQIKGSFAPLADVDDERIKRNSSIPMIQPQRKRSGELLPVIASLDMDDDDDVDDCSSDYEESLNDNNDYELQDESNQAEQSSTTPGPPSLHAKWSSPSTPMLKKPMRKSSFDCTSPGSLASRKNV